MSIQFVIEDIEHAETMSEHGSLAEAWAALRHLAGVAWDAEPNLAPCTDWANCGRRYEIVAFDASTDAWVELERFPGFEINRQGVVWADAAPGSGAGSASGLGAGPDD